MNVTAVVLAGGRARRMGQQKLVMPLGGVPILQRVLNACAHLPTVVIASPDLRDFLAPLRVRAVFNADPDRGMSHSLRLADTEIDPAHALLVLLGDKPLVHAALVERVLSESKGTDVCYPIHDHVGGHPVYFSQRARERIASLPEGDTLARLRDDPSLHSHPFACSDIGAYADVDTTSDLNVYNA